MFDKECFILRWIKILATLGTNPYCDGENLRTNVNGNNDYCGSELSRWERFVRKIWIKPRLLQIRVYVCFFHAIQPTFRKYWSTFIVGYLSVNKPLSVCKKVWKIFIPNLNLNCTQKGNRKVGQKRFLKKK